MNIQSTPNPNLFMYKVDVEGVKEEELRAFCTATRNDIENFRSHDGQLYAPSLYLSALTPKVIQLINEKYDGSSPEKKIFPIKKSRGCPPGNSSSTQSNRIFLNEDFVVTVQVFTITPLNEKEDQLLCKVEIFKNDIITLGGILTFTGEKS